VKTTSSSAPASTPEPDLVPTGDPETDLTQLVTLIESAFPDEVLPTYRPAIRDVIQYAHALRSSWADNDDAP
jgi:hypothetical protein